MDEVVSQSVESLTKEYDEVLCKVMDKLTLVKYRTIVIRPNAPWYNEEIANQKRKVRASINGVLLVWIGTEENMLTNAMS